MDLMLKKILYNNACRIKTLREDGFPTHFIFTRREDLIGEHIEFIDKGYISGYDLLRNRQEFINESEEIVELTVHNPKYIEPISLPDYREDVDVILQGIEKWKDINLMPMCSRGDPFKLKVEYKQILIDLYLATGSNGVKESTLDRYLEDIYYGFPKSRTMSQLRYGFFFAMDFDWKSDEEALAFAVKKWFSLIGVYKELYSQDENLSAEWKKLISNIVHPEISVFKSYEQIIDYWPYCLSPRPPELLKSHVLPEFNEA